MGALKPWSRQQLSMAATISAFEFASRWFYNVVSFRGRALRAPVAELRS
jgi:hypothetical protein